MELAGDLVSQLSSQSDVAFFDGRNLSSSILTIKSVLLDETWPRI
jgi:hypothetical protein